MTTPPIDPGMNERREQLLDGHLIGTLNATEQSEFAALVAGDSGFATQVKLQERAAASLRRTYVPPESKPLVEDAGEAPARRLGHWWRYAAAAVIAVGVFFGVRWAMQDTSNAPGAIYARMVSAGFSPSIICRADEGYFERLVKGKLGKALVPTLAADSPVAFTGWNYAKDFGTPLSDSVMILLVKNGKTPVVVFMDKATADRPQPLSRKGLSVFRAEINGLVLYEVSPLPEPCVLPLLHGE